MNNAVKGSDEFTTISNGLQMATYLEALGQPGVAALRLESGNTEEHPLVVADEETDVHLVFEFTAIRDVVPALRAGAKFTVFGYTSGGFVRTEPMKVKGFESKDGRLFGTVDWPEQIEVKQRRASFRATLRVGMEVGVYLRSSDHEGDETVELQGDLRDLSADGCLAEFSIYDGASKVLPNQSTVIELYFPNGRTLELMAGVRHVRTDNDRKVLAVGFEFQNVDQELHKELWNFVKEIERESSRSAGGGDNRTPSELFRVKDPETTKLGRRRSHDYPTPTAKRLATIAGYLDSQMILLKQEGVFDPYQLSVQTDHLLDLLKEDREGVLFALHCLYRESRWVQHGIAVAARLGDLLYSMKVPHTVLKAATAAAMVHDLGKGVINQDIWRATTLSRPMYLDMQDHVPQVLDAAKKIKWLAPAIRDNVIGQVNERLDGSGYPQHLKGEAIGQLARAAMVVDAMDAMQRSRPDRAAVHAISALAQLQAVSGRYDPIWIERYLNRFGRLPIGSLLKFEGGVLAWVVGLDRHNRVERLRLTPHKNHPDHKLGELIQGSKLRELGSIRDVLVVDD
ncbi:HD domain-containing phosphohydrolase [Pseudidiomarina homiensis]|nr:HD domain-containing phosphohydrolase [Pseudidiomarina homiensis]